jgi:hypothetical protein
MDPRLAQSADRMGITLSKDAAARPRAGFPRRYSVRDSCDRKAAARTIKEPSKSRHALIRCSARHGLDSCASLKRELPKTIFSTPPGSISWAQLMRLCRNRSIVLLTFSYVCMNYVYYLIGNWCCLYLVQERHFTILEGGWLAAAPPLAAAVGAGVGASLQASYARGSAFVGAFAWCRSSRFPRIRDRHSLCIGERCGMAGRRYDTSRDRGAGPRGAWRCCARRRTVHLRVCSAERYARNSSKRSLNALGYHSRSRSAASLGELRFDPSAHAIEHQPCILPGSASLSADSDDL